MAFSDTDLISRVMLDDDRNAFGELVRRYQSEVRNFLRRLTKQDHARADDLAQETFIRAFRYIGQFRGKAKFSSWLYRIAYRVFLNDCRKRRESVTYGDEMEFVPDTKTPTPKGLVADVDDALNRLDSACRAVFDLYYKKGMTHAETAEALEMPLGTVKSHLSRGKEVLRAILKDWSPNAGVK